MMTMPESAVLIVEDDRDIREAIAEVLQIKGYKILTAGDGEQALRILRQGPAPSIILLDLMMPTLDGLGFLAARKEKSEWRKIPVIVLTADGRPELKVP